MNLIATKHIHSSADQLSRFGLDNQGIDHFVKGENEKYSNIKGKIVRTRLGSRLWPTNQRGKLNRIDLNLNLHLKQLSIYFTEFLFKCSNNSLNFQI